jgi:hypothetical protein
MRISHTIFNLIIWMLLSHNAYSWNIDKEIHPNKRDFDNSDGIVSQITQGGFAKKYSLTLEQTAKLETLIKEIQEVLPLEYKDQIKVNIKIVTMSSPSVNIYGMYLPLSKVLKLNYELVRQMDLPQVYNTLKKTIIHELTHAYEAQVKNISKSPDFYYQAGFADKGFLFHTQEQRNFNASSSPDIYEYTNKAEALAVNAEYFFLDKTYKCRRPTLYNYLSKQFHFSPFENEVCDSHEYIPVTTNNGILFESLANLKLYQVHYLLADKGTDLDSRWGHTMLRMVFCDPKREVAGPDCLKDIDYHYVISYRMGMPSENSSKIDIALKRLPMKMFVYPMGEIITEYSASELRDLVSSPLKLTNEQLNKVKTLMIEEAWGYTGKYRILSSNCATDALVFLKSIYNNSSLYSEFATTPRGTMELLEKKGYLDPYYRSNKLSEEEKKKNTYLFKSKKELYNKIFLNVQQYFPKYKNINDFLDYSSAQSRRSLIDQLESNESNKKIISSLYVMEKLVLNRLITSITNKVKGKLGKDEELTDIIKQQTAQMGLGSSKAKYGVPLMSEIRELVTPSENIDRQKVMALADAFDYFDKIFPEDFKLRNKINENLELLKEKMKK